MGSAMDPNLTTLERAFQLAASGRCATVTEIKLHLHKEGYRHELIEGPLLAKQLMDAITKARSARSARATKSKGQKNAQAEKGRSS